MAKDFMSEVFFGWWGEQNKVLQWIKSIPFLMVMGPVLLVVSVWDKVKSCWK